MLDKPEVTLTIRLPHRLSNRLNRAASDLDQTRGELIRRALSSYLDADKTKASAGSSEVRDPDHVIQ